MAVWKISVSIVFGSSGGKVCHNLLVFLRARSLERDTRRSLEKMYYAPEAA